MNESEVKRKWIDLLLSLLSAQWLDMSNPYRPPLNQYMQEQADKTTELMHHACFFEEAIEWTRKQFDEVIETWINPE